jgi:hypothetical protein
MSENAELDGDLFELLVNICLDRMNDRSYQVRAQAAKASGRLQNTKDADDLITKRNFFSLINKIRINHSLRSYLVNGS